MNSQISNNTNFLLLMRFTFNNNRQTDSHIEYNQYNFTNAYFQAVSIQGRTDKKKLSDNAKLQSKIKSLRYASG